jgi:hypothetical protein
MKIVLHTAPKINFRKTAYFWLTKYEYNIAYRSALTPNVLQIFDTILINSQQAYSNLLNIAPQARLWKGKKPNFTHLVGKSIEFEYAGKIKRVIAIPEIRRMFDKPIQVLYLRLLKKVHKLHEEFFTAMPSHTWRYYSGAECQTILSEIAELKPVFLAIDLETKELIEAESPSGESKLYQGVIDLIVVSALTLDAGGVATVHSFLFSFTHIDEWRALRAICASPYPKVFHNGFYDLEYLTRWRCPVINYLWDTQDFFRSICNDYTGWYALHNVAGFYCRDAIYWKELTSFDGVRNSKGSHWNAYLEYTSLDGYYTAVTALNQLQQFEVLNLNNYAYRKQFDSLSFYCSMQGLKIDVDLRDAELERQLFKFRDDSALVYKLWGLKPTQSKKLQPIVESCARTAKDLGVPDVFIPKGTGAEDLDSLKEAHPLFHHVFTAVGDARQAKTRISTNLVYKPFYRFDTEEEYLRYSLNTYTTLSCRYASNKSAMWCGAQIQNIPVSMRSIYIPDDGYIFVSIDAPQSESYTTGFLSDCKAMIDVLEDPEKDFHKFNASSIFSLPYESVTSEYRTLAKPAGHGYNYGLTGFGLLRNAGIAVARKLKKAMKHEGSLVGACVETFKRLDSLYWEVRERWYPQQVWQVIKKSRLFCLTGFAPLILKDPLRNPRSVNSIVSMESQNLSVHLNLKGGNSILKSILNGEYSTEWGEEVKICFQLHDELVLQIRRDWSVAQVDKFADKHFSNETKHRSGKIMKIPVGIPVFADYLNECKYDEVPRDSIPESTPIWKLTPTNYKKFFKEVE